MRKRSLLLFVLLTLAILLSACIFIGGGYKKTGNSYVYATSDESNGYVEHPIADIHVESFQILNQYGYAKDDLRVYYRGNPVQGANPGDFVAMTEWYGKDNDHMYYAGKIIPGADPKSFAIFDIQWGKDSKDAYYQNGPINACDPATFVLMKDFWQWERDSQCVYRQGKKLPNADPASFVALNFWFGKDKNSVYDDLGRIIEGADAATFKIKEGICQVCGQDKNRCYQYEKPADCKSLK